MYRWSIFLFVFVFFSNSFAEPTPLVSKLMDTPASMFDIGMIKIQKQLDIHAPGYGVSYSWEKNRFEINKYFFDFDKAIECKTEKSCKDLVKAKNEADTKNVLCFEVDKKCNIINIASEFSHAGYMTKNFYNNKSSDEAVKELHNLFYVITILFKTFNGTSKKITCERAITEVSAMCTDAVEISKN